MSTLKKLFLLTFFGIFTLTCKKIPERGPILIEAISANAQILSKGETVEVAGGQQVDIAFRFFSDAPLDSVYVQLQKNLDDTFYESDVARITKLPKNGDEGGTFVYRLSVNEQFDTASQETKTIRVRMLNSVGTIQWFDLKVKKI